MGSIWQETKRDNIVINIRFKTKNDIAKINSHKKNLTNNAKNNVYQYVSAPLLTRFIAWETAGYKIRNDRNQTVTTRIRAGKFDFYLLVRDKTDTTPWNMIKPN